MLRFQAYLCTIRKTVQLYACISIHLSIYVTVDVLGMSVSIHACMYGCMYVYISIHALM